MDIRPLTNLVTNICDTHSAVHFDLVMMNMSKYISSKAYEREQNTQIRMYEVTVRMMMFLF